MTLPLDRRSFVKVTGAAGLAGILSSQRAPAWAQGTTLHILRWNDFVPAGDEVLARQMIEAQRLFGAKVTLERINANDIQARVTAAVSSGTGPDIIHMLHNWLAKDFLKWLHSREAYEPWFVAEKGYAIATTRAWETHAMWNQDPVMLAFRDAARSYRLFGSAGPPSAKATEAFSKYIVVDMYAKAIQGLPPEESVKWAAGELTKIYA